MIEGQTDVSARAPGAGIPTKRHGSAEGERRSPGIRGLSIRGLSARRVIRHPELWRIFTFLFAGGTSAVVTLAVTSLLTDSLHVLFLVSAIMGTELGILVNFGINDRQTFRDLAGHRRPFSSRLLRFHLTCALGQSLILISSLLLHDVAHWRTIFSQALPIVVVTAINFTMHRFWTYRAGRTTVTGLSVREPM